MDQLITFLPQGGAVVGVLVCVGVFLKLVSRMTQTNENVITKLCENQEKARGDYFQSLRELSASYERIQSQMVERFEGLERAVEGLTAAVAELRR